MTNVGLRARKAARTRFQIAEAALAYFMEKGYDATTLDEIADAADIHKRTLLRYFPSKIHLALHTQYDSLAEFEILAANRGDTPIIDVWQEFVTRNARAYKTNGHFSYARMRITMREPSLTAAMQAIQLEYQRLIARGLCEDMGRDFETDIVSRVAAAALVGANHSVAWMLLEKRAFAEVEPGALEVIRLVRATFLAHDFR